jgi:hypothetical protein
LRHQGGRLVNGKTFSSRTFTLKIPYAVFERNENLRRKLKRNKKRKY